MAKRTVNGYGMDGRMDDRNSTAGYHCVHIGSEVHSASYPMDTGDSRQG
jgi:hypothetical protein